VFYYNLRRAVHRRQGHPSPAAAESGRKALRQLLDFTGPLRYTEHRAGDGEGVLPAGMQGRLGGN